ncbi:hypothetical protein B0H63DRAFT_379267, partial [Podospora didyma]
GVFVDDGNGGFISDLEFKGGVYGAYFNNRQFTARNLNFTDCRTAIFISTVQAMTLHGVDIRNCEVGVDIS